ncbi:hypothetical protein TW83_10110 [Paracoccus sp. S4493]|nr:hypothetical protein TW83_10110 [Paracoccus sp. S4493]
MCLLEGLQDRDLPEVFYFVYCRDVHRAQRSFECLISKIQGMSFGLGDVSPWFMMARLRELFHYAVREIGDIRDPRIAELVDIFIEVAVEIDPDFLANFDHSGLRSFEERTGLNEEREIKEVIQRIKRGPYDF